MIKDKSVKLCWLAVVVVVGINAVGGVSVVVVDVV